MADHVRIRTRAYLCFKHREIVHFKTFDTDVSVDDVLEEILTTKKDITRIYMDRENDKQDYYSI